MVSVKEWALDYADLVSVLHYTPATGVFTWLIDRGSKIEAGDRAGTVNKDGYRAIVVAGFSYKAHRLAWFYMKKTWPKAELDHINREYDDNRWENLREATRQQNNRNAGLRKDSTTGYKGVGFHKLVGKYQARIRLDGKQLSLGWFTTPEEASAAYQEASRRYFGEFSPDKTDLN